MATQRKKNINIKPGKFGEDLRRKYYNSVSQNSSFLPKSVLHEDMDRDFINFVDTDLSVVVQDKKVPTIFLTIQRWSEYTKTWQSLDVFKNIKIPFVSIIRNPDAQPVKDPLWYKIPDRKTFPYTVMPVWDGNRKGIDVYSIPQPVPIELTYEVRFFCHRMRDLNKLNKKVLEVFASGQKYIQVNGHYFPIMLNSIGDESQIDGFDSKKFYVQLYEMKLIGYLLDSEEFKITPALDRIVVMTETNLVKSYVKPLIKRNGNLFDLEYTFESNVSTTSASFTLSTSVHFTVDELINLTSYSLTINSNPVAIPFTAQNGTTIDVSVLKTDSSIPSKLILSGKNLGVLG